MPERLPSRPISHYYRGGENIAKLRRITLDSDYQPEEWIGSTVSRFDDDKLGLTVLEDGSLLRDAVAADPHSWTGQSRTGSDVGVLVKLLDAGQRLPVHVHPDRKFAASHLDCPYGKSEAWYVISALPGSAVYVGWNTDLDPADLRITARVDGELRQDGSTSQLVRSVAELIAYASTIFTLLPGDVLLTGTPAGVGPIEHGQRVEVEIEGIGVLGNPVLRR